jgi:hypothetical protein
MRGEVDNPLLPSPDLSNTDLPGANWADQHCVMASTRGLCALGAAKMALGGPSPGWISLLMRTRNLLGRLVGLKTAEISVDQGRIGAFPIVSESFNKVVLGFNDWHLDFRIVVETADVGEQTSVCVSTLVNRKNWFGRAYIFAITPFHVMIVKRLLRNVERSALKAG